MATKASIILSAVDRATGPIRRIGRAYQTMSKRNKAAMRTTGQVAARAGAALTAVSVGLAGISLKKSGDVESALGRLASVGIKDLALLREAGLKFSNEWVNATAPEFIDAAYDIKSGISSLSDEGVAGFTKFAGITAMATKATVGEMTSLFATGYGIFRKLHKGMSDLEFGKMLSAGIAGSVQRYKTTGQETKAAIESLGSVATASNVPLAEQLAILGRLQVDLPGGAQAGTKYKSYLQGIVKAGKELGLPFLDANRQIKSLPVVLDLLRQKFGDTLNAIEMDQIKRAFGRKEAVDLITKLWEETEILRKETKGLAAEMEGGLAKALEMATVQNEGMNEETERTGNRLSNLAAIIGGALTPSFLPLMQYVGETAVKLQKFAAAHPELVSWIIKGAIAVGGLVAVLGTLAATLTLINFAVLANPVTWVVAAIIAAVAALIAAGIWLMANWEEVKAWWADYWKRLTEAPAKAWADIKAGMATQLAALGALWDDFMAAMGTVGEFFTDMWEGIAGAFDAGVGWIARKLEDAVAWVTTKARALVDWLPDWALDKLGLKVDAGQAPAAFERASRSGAEDLRPQAQRTQVGGLIKVQFDNAPPGTRIAGIERTGDGDVEVSTGLTLPQPWI